MRSKISAAAFAGLIAVLSLGLSGCSSGNENSAPVSDPVSSPMIENSGNTDPTSEPVSSNTPSEPQKPGEEPTFLKGPDGKPIYPSDITFVEIRDENTPNGIREADISELTEDNLFFVCCENFGYLREPMGINYNRYESSEKFESEFPYLYKGEELFNQNPIKRVYVGDKICGMTLTELETSFQEIKRHTSVPFWGDIPLFKFKGEVTLTGYLSVDSMTPDYPGNEGRVTFWLDEQSNPLPATYISLVENGTESHFCGGIGFYNENYDIDLGSIYDDGKVSASCDETLLDGITYGDNDVHVKIIIDEYMTFGGVDNRAVLKSLERL